MNTPAAKSHPAAACRGAFSPVPPARPRAPLPAWAAAVFFALVFPPRPAIAGENLLGPDAKAAWSAAENAIQWRREDGADRLVLTNRDPEGQTIATAGLGVQRGQGYAIAARAVASPGVTYRFYVESGAGDVWETFLGDWTEGDGAPQRHHVPFRFEAMPSPPYLALQLRGAGTVSVEAATVGPHIDGTALAAERMRLEGQVRMLAAEQEETWRLNSAKNAGGDSRRDADGGLALTLSNRNTEGAAPFWLYPRVPIEPGVGYAVSLKYRGTADAGFHIYIENNTDGNWQGASLPIRKATGQWENRSFIVRFAEFRAPAYAVVRLDTPGTLELTEFTIEPAAAETLVNGDFSEGARAWRIDGGAGAVTADPDAPGNRLLRLSAPDGGMAGASHTAFEVVPSTRYRITYRARGLSAAAGDPTGSHWFRVTPVWDPAAIPADLAVWLNSWDYFQDKRVEFMVPPLKTAVELRVEVRGPAEALFDDFMIESVAERDGPMAWIRLDPPFAHRDGIFASQPAAAITGEAASNDERAARVRFAYEGGDVRPREAALAAGRGVGFSASAPPAGQAAALRAEILDGDGQLLHRAEKILRHFAPAPQEVTFAPDGRTLVNGEPFFMIGHWETGGRGGLDFEMEFLREAGFNTLLLGRTTGDTLDLAWKHGLRLVTPLPERMPGRTPESRASLAGQLAGEWLGWARHPALLAYFGPDEPVWRGLPREEMDEVYQFVRRIDPYHPVWVNEAPPLINVNDLRRYSALADIYGVDIYPVPEGGSHSSLEDKGLSSVGRYVDLYREAVEDRKPVWMILQAFAWPQIARPEVAPDVSAYPTYEQSRFMAFNAITHGATGILYHYLAYARPEALRESFWRDLRKVTRELAYLEPILSAPNAAAPAAASDNPDVRVLEKRRDGKPYYFVVNEAAEPRTAAITGLPPAMERLHVLFDDAPQAVAAGRAGVSLPARGVAIWSTEPWAAREVVWNPAAARPWNTPPPVDPDAEAFKGASWIWDGRMAAQAGSRIAARRVFAAPDGAAKAELFITADDRHRAWLNGVIVSSDWEGEDHLHRGWGAIQRHDVTDKLRPGANVLAAHALDGGALPLGLLAQLRFTFPDGRTESIGSDADWLTAPTADAPEGWRTDTRAEAAGPWRPAAIIAPYGGGVWLFGMQVHPGRAPAAE